MPTPIDSLDRLARLRQRAASSAEALSDADQRTDPLRERAARSLSALTPPCRLRLPAKLGA